MKKVWQPANVRRAERLASIVARVKREHESSSISVQAYWDLPTKERTRIRRIPQVRAWRQAGNKAYAKTAEAKKKSIQRAILKLFEQIPASKNRKYWGAREIGQQLLCADESIFFPEGRPYRSSDNTFQREVAMACRIVRPVHTKKAHS